MEAAPYKPPTMRSITKAHPTSQIHTTTGTTSTAGGAITPYPTATRTPHPPLPKILTTSTSNPIRHHVGPRVRHLANPLSQLSHTPRSPSSKPKPSQSRPLSRAPPSPNSPNHEPTLLMTSRHPPRATMTCSSSKGTTTPSRRDVVCLAQPSTRSIIILSLALARDRCLSDRPPAR